MALSRPIMEKKVSGEYAENREAQAWTQQVTVSLVLTAEALGALCVSAYKRQQNAVFAAGQSGKFSYNFLLKQ
ncbi:hypothetical protein lerEdw1_020992 [Lerista edwardsae]|nr:hypothetical protein lerEdw1_020992 [Lerista edwardsae]